MLSGLMRAGGERWADLGSIVAGVMFVWAMFSKYFPNEVNQPIQNLGRKLLALFYPYVKITFNEYSSSDAFLEASKPYAAIDRYLTSISLHRTKSLMAEAAAAHSQSLVFTVDHGEEVVDVFQGATFWWSSDQTQPKDRQYHRIFDERKDRSDVDANRSFKLTFHKRNRHLATTAYLQHVLHEGMAIETKSRRQRKLYTNNSSEGYYFKRKLWTRVCFDHPANFNTLAMEPGKKKEIVDDLIKFSRSKDYYDRIGKAWKRGYLLYGPPGTGKSTMIAAMANFLQYDVYDLELTVVKDNTELRKLLIDTSPKSIVVIEDIDCSIDLTGQRKKEKEKEKGKEAKDHDQEKEKESKVTLSGILNVIDGLWSACGGERIIIFTTNHLEKLDPALIRRGRMDKHIELSYCGFEAFKILAKNYLDIDSHPLFNTIKAKLEEIKMTPADVTENLTLKSEDGSPDSCLEGLIMALDEAKENARLKAEQEKKEKEDKEEKKSTSAAEEDQEENDN